MSDGHETFFIGWRGPVRAAEWAFLTAVLLVIVSACGLIAWTTAATNADSAAIPQAVLPAPQAPVEIALRGIVASEPYPTIWTAPDQSHPDGHTTLLTGDGKHGVTWAAHLAGKFVEAKGLLFKRGTLDMLVVFDTPRIIDGPAPAMPPVTARGRWRLSGEICDGKCYAGAMRPGSGLAHKACANLCLLGEVPPVFVSASPLAGHEMFMLADRAGRPLPDAVRNRTALPLEIEADVESRGDIWLLKIDLAGARVL
jgi:hypothetical protein